MKIFLYLIFSIFISINTMAKMISKHCPLNQEKCGSENIMDDSGICHNCNDEKGFYVGCFGIEKALQICPNRKAKDSFIFPLKDCPTNTMMEDGGKCVSCLEQRDILINTIGEDNASKLCPNRQIVYEQPKHCPMNYPHSRLCPENNCPEGTFMGDNGNCYDCNTEGFGIEITCIGKELSLKTCPKRGFFGGDDGEVLLSYKCSTDKVGTLSGECCNKSGSCTSAQRMCTDF